jgi:hypothetical protein
MSLQKLLNLGLSRHISTLELTSIYNGFEEEKTSITLEQTITAICQVVARAISAPSIGSFDHAKIYAAMFHTLMNIYTSDLNPNNEFDVAKFHSTRNMISDLTIEDSLTILSNIEAADEIHRIANRFGATFGCEPLKLLSTQEGPRPCGPDFWGETGKRPAFTAPRQKPPTPAT